MQVETVEMMRADVERKANAALASIRGMLRQLESDTGMRADLADADMVLMGYGPATLTLELPARKGGA